MARSGRGDWMDHDDPPPLVAAEVLVSSNPTLLLRSLLPTLIAASALCAWGAAGQGRLLVLILGVVVGTAGVVRAGWWWRRFAARELLTTPTHLALRSRGVVEQWVAWAEVDRLLVVHSDPLPEWSYSRVNWFHVEPVPGTAVVPPQAVLTGFNDVLVSRAASVPAAQRVREAAVTHGLQVEEH